MVAKQLCLTLVLLASVSCEASRDKRARRKNDYHGDKSLWKEEYEEELTNAMLSTKRKDNVTRVIQSAASTTNENEAVIEKLMESITASEKYLKKVESIDFRLNRLDIEVHEKTNTILKQMSDIMKLVKEISIGDKVEHILNALKSDISDIKYTITRSPRTNTGGKSKYNYLIPIYLILWFSIIFLSGTIIRYCVVT